MHTQQQLILSHLRRNRRRGLTSIGAFHGLGVTKLSTRIGELEAKGYRFSRARVKVQNRYGATISVMRYWLMSK